MPDITVPVPDDRVSEFYRFFALWLEGSLVLPDASPQSLSEAPKAADERRSWTGSEEDREDAEKLWSQMADPAKGFYNLLIDAPGTQFTATQIAQELSIPKGANGVAGVLAWPGRYCRKMNRLLPQHWTSGKDGASSVYWMDADVAALFAAVRSELDG